MTNLAFTINQGERWPPSIGGGLLFNILALTKASELLPFEKLFVAENSGLPKHLGHMADVYLECGCRAAAREIIETIGHIRKLGDLAWAMGDLGAADSFYSSRLSTGIAYRYGQDWDRLIKLAFFQSDWPRVVGLVSTAPIEPGLSAGRIILGSSERAGIPFLQMFAVAAMKSGSPLDDTLEVSLANKFGIGVSELHQLVRTAEDKGEENVRKLRKRCPPKMTKTELLTVSEACSRGDTPRSRELLAFLLNADELLVKTKKSLRNFVANGDEEDLILFRNAILSSGVRSVSHSFLFSAFGGFNSQGADPDRLIRLYNCHPIMDKRYFGELLHLKFTSGVELVGREVLTGIFQKLGSLPTPEKMEDLYTNHTLEIDRLIVSRDWAEMRLNDWLEGPGRSLSHYVAEIWRNGTSEKVSGPFGHNNGRPDSPRSMAEWGRIIDAALTWLEDRWTQEIGISPWQSENKLFELLKKAFKGCEVQRHAQPLWLTPQHLDIYVPELSLAVEYMGQQHYEPIDFFGGDEGFKSNVERDERKLGLCRKSGISLEYVRYNETTAERVVEIKARYTNRRSSSDSQRSISGASHVSMKGASEVGI